MNLPSLIILPCPECREPMKWLRDDGHPNLVACPHCGGMFDYDLVWGVEFSSHPPRRPGFEGRDERTRKAMLEALERRRSPRYLRKLRAQQRAQAPDPTSDDDN